MAASLLEVRAVTKTFGAVKVLDGVDCAIHTGEIRALVGHNGSGKSTLIKILAGFHKPDTPTLGRLGDAIFSLGNYDSAHAAGLRFVHQDLGLVDALDAADNIALGADYPRRRWTRTIDWPGAHRRAANLLSSLGYDVPTNVPVGDMSPVERTGIAIGRALQDWPGAAKVIVLDEPTATMPAAEASRLFEVVRRIREQGLAVLYVTHHLDEVLELGDAVTVLRDGREIATRPVGGLSHQDLVELMIGHAMRSHSPVVSGDAVEGDEPVLRVSNLSAQTVANVSLAVGRGEIVGVAGITGSGYDELLQAIVGDIPRSGSVEIGGKPVPANRPHLAVRAGLAYVPADRQRNSIIPSVDVRSNVTASGVKEFVRRGLLSGRAERQEVRQWINLLEVRPNDPDAPVTSLSGGNQQKVVMARWLRRSPKIMVLIEPTQGVDVEARESIYAALKSTLRTGGVLLSSSDSDELAALCDRVVILRRGQLVAELSGSDITAKNIESASLAGSADAA